MTRTNKILIVGGVIFIAYILIIETLAILRKKPEEKIAPPAPSISPIISKSSAVSEFIFSGTPPEIPDMLSVFTNTSASFSSEDWAQDLASTLNLPALEGKANIWIDKSSGEQIAVHSKGTFVQYSAPESIRKNKDVPKGVSDLDFIISSVEEFIAQFNFSPVPQPIKNDIEYLTNTLEPQIVSKAEAELLKIPFQAKLGDYPLQLDGSIAQTIIVYANTNGDVIKIEMSPLFASLTEDGLYSTLSLEEALTKLKAGEGTALSFGLKNKLFTQDQLTSADLNELSIEYRYQQESSKAYPFFRFSGIAKGVGDITADITIILPALKTTPKP